MELTEDFKDDIDKRTSLMEDTKVINLLGYSALLKNRITGEEKVEYIFDRLSKEAEKRGLK